MLTNKPAPASSSGHDAGISTRSDDQSGHAHRQLIGYTGLLLPVVLVVLAGIRNAPGPERWQLLGSISAYYYSGAVAAFTGLLFALALFLFTYRGYRNRYHWMDRGAARIGGFAALGVAFFPTGAPAGAPAPAWWTPLTGWIHYGSAIVLFLCFAFFSLWLFRLSGSGTPASGKRNRNHIHLVCGLTILAAIAWAGFNGFRDRPIFVPESLALAAFAVSWLVKGRAHLAIANAARSVVDRKGSAKAQA